MKRFFIFLFSILLVLFSSQSTSKEPLPLHSSSQEETTTSFLPELHIDQPLLEKSSECEIQVDISVLSETAQKVFKTAFNKFPCTYLHSLRKLEIIEDVHMSRALSGRYTLKLRADVPQKPGFEPLLIHEFCHVLDLGGLQGSPKSGDSPFVDGSLPIYTNDPSVKFYEISWKNVNQKKEESDALDFVTGYALTDPFEDFAETCLLYIEQGKLFQKMATENKVLLKKYEFFRDVVFNGQEFQVGDAYINLNSRPWDATKL